MTTVNRFLRLAGAFAFAVALSTSASAQPANAPAAPLTLTLSALPSSRPLPEEFVGLSFEMELLRARKDGTHYFRPDNVPLLTLFKTLGIKSLRIGGNTADRPTVPFPSTDDIDLLFAFARKAGVKVIFTLRLREGEPRLAGAVAKHIMEHHADLLWCFSIGNEPNVFSPEYPKFFEAWSKFADTVNLPEFAPAARFAGPSSTAGRSAWTRDFAKQLAGTGRLLVATQHVYPGGNADMVKDPADARQRMLSRAWIAGYQKFHDTFVPQVLATGTPFRLVETNSFWNGGRQDASNTFAASLWALDYLHWWAAHGANGLNFHTGDYVAKSEENTRSMYSSFWSTEKGYDVKPIAYGIKAFDLVKHGHPLTATIAENPHLLNVSAHGIRGDDGVFVTIINKEHGPNARAAAVSVMTRPGTAAQIIRLAAASGDVAALDGITLGDGMLNEDGTWAGKWSESRPADDAGKLMINVPAASAVLVKLSQL